MRWRSRARYSAYSAGGPPPGPLLPGPPPVPGVASANPWPARAATLPPPDTPWASVVDSPLPAPVATGGVPAEPVVGPDDSGLLLTVALAEVGPSTDVGASTEVGGSTARGVVGAIAVAAALVRARASATVVSMIVDSERLAADRSEIPGGSGGGTTVRGGAESPARARDAPGGGDGGRFARIPGGVFSLGDPPPALEAGLDPVARGVRATDATRSAPQRS